MRLPLNNPKITSGYGDRIDPISKEKSFHKGTDFVSADTRVFAIADGLVVFDFDNYDERDRWKLASNSSGGNFVILRHIINDIAYFCRYFHLVKNVVFNNQAVPEGFLLGEYGNVGYSTGPHLHFDVTTKWGIWGNTDPKIILGV